MCTQVVCNSVGEKTVVSVLDLDVLERPESSPPPLLPVSSGSPTSTGGGTAHTSNVPFVKLEQRAGVVPESPPRNVVVAGVQGAQKDEGFLLTPNGIHIAIQRKVDSSPLTSSLCLHHLMARLFDPRGAA